jgi:hypothetical protein
MRFANPTKGEAVKQLIAQVSRGERGMMRWKIVVGGITIQRCPTAKMVRRMAKGIRKLFARMGPEAAGAAAVLTLARMHEDADDWGEPDPYRDEYEDECEPEPAAER